MRILIFVAVLLAVVPHIAANRISDAAKAYEEGRYGKAIELYRQIEMESGTSSQLYFDLGQNYTRAGNLGMAMLSYKKALRLDPSNKAARENIKYLEGKVQDANKAEAKGKKVSVTSEPLSFFSSVRHYITDRYSSDFWGVGAGICFVLFCVCVALYIFAREVRLRKAGFFGGGVLLALMAVFMVFAVMAADAFNSHEDGVVTAYKVWLRSEDSASSGNVANPVTQGTVMRILDVTEGKDGTPQWYKVRLNSDYTGWIDAASFEAI